MKIALLKSYPKNTDNLEELYKSVGMNSGNIVYWESIIRLFSPDIVSYEDSCKFEKYDAVIITDLCWIREGAEYSYLESYVDEYQIPFIPLSIGLQNNNFNPDFKLSAQLERMLKKMQERAVLGVRGEYTASILRKHGITNIAVIGCPSMYYWNNRNLKIEDNQTPVNTCCNFKSLGEPLSEKEVLILNYFAKRGFLFIEQTSGNLESGHIKNKSNFKFLHEYLLENTLLEFNYQKWVNRLKDYNFSIGLRFHGNIIALHHNIKALFITIDSRTQEMIDLFHLPYIKKADFDESKALDYYFKLADYEKFNENYPKMYDRFIDFVSKNKLEFSKTAKALSFEAKKNVKVINNQTKEDKFKNKLEEILQSISNKEVDLNQLFIEIGNLFIQSKDKEDYYNIIQHYFNNFSLEEISEDLYGKKNLLKNPNLEKLGINGGWTTSHSPKSYYDDGSKMFVCGNEKECWNILSQKIEHQKYIGKTFNFKVENKTVGGVELHIFARYKTETGEITYLENKAIVNNEKNIDEILFSVSDDIPENAELFVGAYINQPASQAYVYNMQFNIKDI